MNSNVFISVGLDASVLLNCVVHINVNSKCVKISIAFFNHLLSLLENLNFSRPEYLHTDEYKIISVLQCHGVNIVSIKCLLDDQSFNLSEENVSYLLQTKNAIQEVIDRKTNVIRPKVLLQLCQISIFLGKEMTVCKTTNITELEDSLKRIDPTTISTGIPTSEPCFVAQLMIYTSNELARGWLAASIVPDLNVDRPRTRAFTSQQKAKVSRRIIGPQAAFSKVCKSFGVYGQYPFKQDEIPGDFIFCTSIPFISYRISENKNANPLFEKQMSPTTSAEKDMFEYGINE
ncbi:hypothetical protein AGLY_011581 [Aphis glycines]|uniref:Uncharacterized protein n=1 Tax=Aphis glycines TaxID=307491 RepID=A0A6G0TD99_APHGL|nr:hypothetical protein AGLY_011581 [Aphis glycines]